jgi:hypothetical protein
VGTEYLVIQKGKNVSRGTPKVLPVVGIVVIRIAVVVLRKRNLSVEMEYLVIQMERSVNLEIRMV